MLRPRNTGRKRKRLQNDIFDGRTFSKFAGVLVLQNHCPWRVGPWGGPFWLTESTLPQYPAKAVTTPAWASPGMGAPTSPTLGGVAAKEL